MAKAEKSKDAPKSPPTANKSGHQREPMPVEFPAIAGPLTGSAGKPRPYAARHVEVLLEDGQRHAMRELLDRLNSNDARLANGRHVTTGADVIRWITDQAAAAGAGQNYQG